MLETLLVPPYQEEHVYLAHEINDQAEDKCVVDARETGRAEGGGDGRRGACVVSVGRPYLAPICTLPQNLVLPSVQLHDDQNSSYSGDHNDKRPEEFGDACPNIRSVG